jgi:hypothetical protein
MFLVSELRMVKRIIVTVIVVAVLPIVGMKSCATWQRHRAERLIEGISRLKVGEPQEKEISDLRDQFGDALTVTYAFPGDRRLAELIEPLHPPRWGVEGYLITKNGVLVEKRLRVEQNAAPQRQMIELSEIAKGFTYASYEAQRCSDEAWPNHPGLIIHDDPRHLDLWYAILDPRADEHFRSVAWKLDLRCLSTFGRCRQASDVVPEWETIVRKDKATSFSEQTWLDSLKSRPECSDFLHWYKSR